MKTKPLILSILSVTICILFFLLGRVSMFWYDSCGDSIKGVTFADPVEVSDFIDELEAYDKKNIGINELDIFEELEANIAMENASFVASKRGKYYYPIDSKKGDGLSKSSRVYFSSANEAETYGYTRSD